MDRTREKTSPQLVEAAALQRRVAELEEEVHRLREQGVAPISAAAETVRRRGVSRPAYDEWYRLLAQNSNDVIWVRDLDLRITYISPSIERITGFTPEESLGMNAEQRLTPASLEQMLARLREALANPNREVDEAIESEIYCKDGSTRWVESTVTLLKDTAGEPLGLLGVSRDITERRRIRQELETRNRVLESIFSNLRQIFFTLDVTHQRLLEISPACEDIYGLPPERFLAHPMAWLDPVLEEDRELLQEGFEALRRGERDASVAEYRIRRPDGKLRWLRSRINRRQENGVVYFDGFVTDITERKRLEGQLMQAQKMEAIGTLAGGIAHDMNNVLGVVMGLGSVLQAEVGEESPLRKHVDGILSVARRGRDLTTNLLGFARKGKFHREAVVLNLVAEEVLSLIGRTVPKSIVIHTRLDGALDPVEGDPGQLNHALMNLCLNACDAMGEGGTLTITTRNVKLSRVDTQILPDLEPGRHARVQVIDTGSGMSPETVKRAFEPFFSTKPKGRGTGLGLSMVYGTIKNHGGTITLESELGKGTTVTILLPTIARVAATATAAREKHAAPHDAKGTVLLVDDEDLFRFAAEQMLTALGYDVLAVDSGAAALEAYRAHRDAIVLVLLDLQMPVMDGEETFAELRALDPRVPVLLCSGFSVEHKAERLLRAGALGYLQKPFELDTLTIRIARALRRQKGKRP